MWDERRIDLERVIAQEDVGSVHLRIRDVAIFSRRPVVFGIDELE